MSSFVKLYELDNKKEDKRIKKIYKHLPKPTFRWVLLGSTGSGKTSVIKNVLFNESWGYNKYFDEVYVFMGSLDDTAELKHLIDKYGLNDRIAVYGKFDNSKVQRLFDSIERDNAEAEERRNVLMIFDDQVTHGLSKHVSTNIIDTIYMRGRHANISCIISTQKYMLLNQNVRQLNVSQLTVFYGTEKTDLTKVAQEHAGSLTTDEFLKVIYDNLKEPYQSFTVDKKASLEERYKNKDFIPIKK